MEHLKLSDGEWKLMKMLWAGQPQTLAELVTALDADTRWSRATIFMMLKRLIAKGAVTMDDSGKFQKYSAAITYSDVEPEETESFLSKVYGGSVGMMVSNLVGRGALSEQEIQELKAILDAAEKQEDPHAERSFDRFRADCSRAVGAGDIQKPRAEADALCALAGRAFETLLAGNTGFSAGFSGRGRGSSGAERRAARADCTGDSATRTNRDETANTCAATGFPGTRNCETGCKAVDDGTDSSNCLVQRQRIARTLAVRRVGGVYDSAAPRPAFSRQARRNVHLCFRRGQIAVPCRSDSGSLPDGRRAEERHD